MAYNKDDTDKQGTSFMDGIPVKISEQYKPPKRISVPGAILNKLSTNIQLPEYNFTLERSVLEKMNQLRQMRKDQRESRRERMEAERRGRTSTDPAIEASVSPPHSEPCPILTPVPINASTRSQSSNYSKPFNISDFEQDTSSPFDNVELKTINDLEELALVLQPIVIRDDKDCRGDVNKPPLPRLNGYNTQLDFNHVNSNWSNNDGQMFPSWHQNTNAPSSQSYVVQRLDLGTQGSKSVPDIIHQLGAELKGLRVLESYRPEDQPQRPASIGPTELSRKSDRVLSPLSLPNPYNQLSPSCQQLVDRLTEMGFPRPRVARAAQHFQDDEARIVEFLVQTQRLEEETKHPDYRVERALVANNYNTQDTVNYLNSVSQLLDLGFNEDQVERALNECGLDTDKALDLLVL